MILTRVGPMSWARISGLLYGIMGLIFGACFSLISLFGGFAAPGPESAQIKMFGVAAIVILPIFYGVVGFVFTYVGAVLYNWMARLVGGFELDLQ